MQKPFKVIGLVILGIGCCAAGIYVGETDDAPGAAVIGLGMMATAFIFAWKTARRGT